MKAAYESFKKRRIYILWIVLLRSSKGYRTAIDSGVKALKREHIHRYSNGMTMRSNKIERTEETSKEKRISRNRTLQTKTRYALLKHLPEFEKMYTNIKSI